MSLQDELAQLLTRHRTDRRTNTPPDVLAWVMVEALRVFEDGITRRASHRFYGDTTHDPFPVPRDLVRHSAPDGLDGPVSHGRCLACEDD